MRTTKFNVVLGLFLGGLASCGREEKGAPPPVPVTSPEKNACEGAVDVQVLGLPGTVGDYCVDPRADVRRYGVAASLPLDAVCVELFNGECELYKSYGLEGVKTLRYVHRGGGRQAVNAVVSSFRRSTGAFGFFTRRILSDGGPSQVTVKPLAVSGRAVSGVGMAVIWRGKDVVEITYVSEEETPAEIESNSARVLPPLANAIANSLLGPTEPERAVRFLEDLRADQLGVSVVSDALLKVVGTGPGALGYFSGEGVSHRIVVAERPDAAGASDLMRMLRRAGTSQKLKDRDIVSIRLTHEEAAPETWYFRTNEEIVLGVGPLGIETAPTQTTPAERKAREAAWEEFAIRRLIQVSGRELKFGP